MSKDTTDEEKAKMVKKAVDMYMKQDGERKKAMMMIDQAIHTLGPVEKAKGSYDLVDQANIIHDEIKRNTRTKPVDEIGFKDADLIVEDVARRIGVTGEDKTAKLFSGKPNIMRYEINPLPETTAGKGLEKT